MAAMAAVAAAFLSVLVTGNGLFYNLLKDWLSAGLAPHCYQESGGCYMDIPRFDDGLDIEKFWRDDEAAHANNCFNDGSKVALGIRMNGECIFDELGIPVSHPWDPQDADLTRRWTMQYNDRAEQIVGRRLLDEDIPPKDAAFPEIRRIGEVFGGEYVWRYHTEWLEKGVNSFGELEKILERAETMDYREFMLPACWESEKKRIWETYGIRPQRLRHVRGPITLACSVMGPEEFIYLVQDEPDLARRFSRAMTHAILEMARVMDEEAGEAQGVGLYSTYAAAPASAPATESTPARAIDPATATAHAATSARATSTAAAPAAVSAPATVPGFSFADDNCCLMNLEMYELFGYPVLRDVFARYSPAPGDPRFQHSDSDMAHLLPALGKLRLNGVNFGPNVLVPEIREHLPDARIDGCIAPFAFSRNDERMLTEQTLRDTRDGLAHGGVNISTAGSINYGSSLASLRLIMAIIQQHGRK
ncbi:MAG: hypothetical protein FWH01_15070 [Oscillospiraceae bacterium]|nr:hypothetical protein [Oscillospiraceae bacterium]